jgi:hypothetical protein
MKSPQQPCYFTKLDSQRRCLAIYGHRKSRDSQRSILQNRIVHCYSLLFAMQILE